MLLKPGERPKKFPRSNQTGPGGDVVCVERVALRGAYCRCRACGLAFFSSDALATTCGACVEKAG